MLLWLFGLFRKVRAALLSNDSARQLAWGITLGVLLGVIPKGNLLAITIGIFILSLTANHALALASAALFTFCGLWLDPVSDRVGQTLLTNPTIRRWMTELQSLPVVPWFSLNNSVVLGSFAIGLLALGPVYWTVYPIMSWWKKRRAQPTPPSPVAAVEMRIDPPETIRLETHIDVVRLSRHADAETKRPAATTSAQVASLPSDANEALRYLVRHVRESREEKAA